MPGNGTISGSSTSNSSAQGGSSSAIGSNYPSKFETGWYFDDISDTDPMVPEDDRERELVELLGTMTVEEIIEGSTGDSSAA